MRSARVPSQGASIKTMKFICCLHNNHDERPFEIYTLPDTALHINKRPFFIPDYAAPCLMQVHRAVRICRLGRSISRRFAYRYYDAVTLCARMEAVGIPPTVGRCFDECLSVGEWLEKGGVESTFDAEACDAIALVSQYFTLRQGDVIILDAIRDAEEVKIDQHVEEKFYNTTVLQFNIK